MDGDARFSVTALFLTGPAGEIPVSRRLLWLQSRSKIPHSSGTGGGVAMPRPQAPVQGSSGSGVILLQSWATFL